MIETKEGKIFEPEEHAILKHYIFNRELRSTRDGCFYESDFPVIEGYKPVGVTPIKISRRVSEFFILYVNTVPVKVEENNSTPGTPLETIGKSRTLSK